MEFFRTSRDIPGVEAETVFDIAGFSLRNSSIMLLLIIALVVVLAVSLRRWSIIPKGLQNVWEYLYEMMFDFVEQITGSRRAAEAIFPVIGSLFIFIGLANLLALIPGVTGATYNGVPILRTATADINTTLPLAIVIVLALQIVSLARLGLFGYLGKFVQVGVLWEGLKKGPGAFGTALVEFFVGLLDVIGELAKIVSLSLRLFGNMYAGEVLGVLVFGAVAYVLPAGLLVLNLLFGVVQAMVFGALAAAYYSLADAEGDKQPGLQTA